ncbi:MAG: GHKL domain-containing protein [Clostridia bacterium]|nr:GHKL domain-containing protein [Clostridia bacterium]
MYRFWQYPVFILHDLAAMACMTALLRSVRGFPERRRAVTAACCVLALLISAVNIALLGRYVTATDPDTGFTVYGLVSLVPILVLPQVILRTSKRLSSALICLALNAGMEGLFSVFGFLFGKTDVYSYHFYETVFCAAGYVLTAVFLLYGSKKSDLNAVSATVAAIPKWLYAVIIVCSFSSFFSVMGEDPELYDFALVSGVLRALSVLGIIAFAGFFVVKVFSLMAKQNRLLERMDALQDNFEKMNRSNEEIRRFRHDFRNHMIVVTSFLGANQAEAAAEYLRGIDSEYGVTERRISTGNFVVDAILSAKQAAAAETGTELSFSGMIPASGIENADLCTVVGNLVDNAVESARRFPGKRRVSVRAGVRDGRLTLTVANPVEKRVEIKNNRVRTTKADRKNHGIGLKNAEAAVKKYDGALILSCTDTEFTVDAAMKLRV